MPAYLLPSLHDALAQNRPAELLTLAVAGWFATCAPSTRRCAHYRGRRPRGRLQSLARAGGDDPRPLLTVRELFGDLGNTRRFVATLEHMLGSIDRNGLQATLHAFLPEPS